MAQTRVVDRVAQERIHNEHHTRMAVEMERQLASQGYYVPFGPVCMVVARKVGRVHHE